ncbi:type II secretion system minor pseudopilin GspK [Agarivorans sp. MS3-6]|uniref:type II secretion system minor pseudopilin GspK n=1 Tax=Agarivorans sp. TSD2052 TaxID=2937286 RepID=UPI00200FC9A9|nr:type II secretion system minor pseudopilin GspK [Agarivorans sp. TSD2052]UPW18247.1 type II secretion system minor pseudopilin GspK [Agarivorans sp. TSD2052]
MNQAIGSLQRQRGVALLTVMLILAVMVVVASQFSQRLQLDLARATNLQHSLKSNWLLAGAEAFAFKVLKQDLEDDDRVHLGQYWATEGMVFPVEDSVIKGQMIDLQACFNLNALGQPNKTDGQPPKVADQFIGLLVAVGVDAYTAEQITDATRDWIDSDTIPHQQGAEDSTYEGLSPAYLPSNMPMVDRSEFRAVYGVTAAIYRRVAPYICAIPEASLAINVNTIAVDQPQLLEALFYPDLDNTGAQQVLNDRPDEGYRTLDELMTHPALAPIPLTLPGLRQTLSLNSNYFMAKLQVENEQGQAQMTSVIQRSGTSDLKLIRRSYGGEL